MAIEGLKRVFDISAIKKEQEKNFSNKKKTLKKEDKNEKKDDHKIDIKI